jgi:hypothetical protein
MGKKRNRMGPGKKNQSAAVPATGGSKKLLKISSIAVIAIFLLIIALGLIRECYSRHSSAQLTASQLQAVKDVVQASLQAKGDDIANYQFSISNKMMRPEQKERQSSLIAVCLYSNSTRLAYLIDINSTEIALSSETRILSGNINIWEFMHERPGSCHVQY